MQPAPQIDISKMQGMSPQQPVLHPLVKPPQLQASAQPDQQPEPSVAPQKEHNTGIYKYVPDAIINNAPQITNAGLFTGTGIMLHSGYRGKVISQDIYDAQMKMITDKPGMTADRAKNIVDLAVKERRIVAPGWHKMRLYYLLTAMVSFGIGAVFKRKEETPEQKEAYQKMGLVEYMRTRTQEALDPVNHSRQTVGVISGASGILAILSAFSQPGGIAKSELYVGTTLATGGALLAYVNNAQTAQNLFSGLWMARLPAIVSGAREFTVLTPKYKDPHLIELKQEPKYFEGMKNAYENGHNESVWLGLKTVKRKGDAAVRAYSAGYGTKELPYKRMDIAYPIGQVTNMLAASVGFLGKGASKAKAAEAANDPVAPVVNGMPPAAANDGVELAPPVKSPIDAIPQPKVQRVADIEHMQAANDQQYAITANVRA